MKKNISLLFVILFSLIVVGCKGNSSNGNNNNSNVANQECSHDWIQATCISPQTCLNCNKTVGGASTQHNYVSGVCTDCGVKDPKIIQIAAAQEAYNDLAYVHMICGFIISTIYDAWYFSIYEADDCAWSACLDEFCSERL